MSSSIRTTTVPLTTVFTPPASCSTLWTYEDVSYNAVTGGLLIQNALPSPLDWACFPSGFAAKGRVNTLQVFSPGACPIGYTSPAIFQNDATTTAVCCQSGFSYYTTISTVNDGDPLSIFAGCLSTYSSGSTTTVPARSAHADLNMNVITGPVTMWGQPITVEFRQRDLSLFSTSATVEPSSATPSPTAASSPSATSTDTVSNGISDGAKAGIGGGVAAMVFLITACVSFFLWRKRRARASQIGSSPVLHPEMESTTPRGELQGTSSKHKLKNMYRANELEA